MRTTLLTYSSRRYWLAQRILCFSAKWNGADRCILLNRRDLVRTEFYRKHKSILDVERGGGYWLWKPYYIAEMLKQLNENDVLIYADAGIIFRKPLSLLTQLVDRDNEIAVFYNDVKASDYTKRDVFVAMNCDEPAYHNAPMIHAGLQVYRKTSRSVAYAEEVLQWCCSGELITDAPNKLGLPDLPGFIENRHDQSIATLVAHKQRRKIFLDPTQFRSKNVDYIFGQGDIPLAHLPYQSVAYVHRYKNLQMWRLLADVVRKKSKATT